MVQKLTPRDEIVADGVAKVERARGMEVRFPDVRAVFGGTALMSSFAHAIPDASSTPARGEIILREIALAAGLDHQSGRVTNIAYDHAKLTIKNQSIDAMPQYPGDHKLAIGRPSMGDFPTVLDAEKPIFLQELKRSINFRQIREFTEKAFDGSEEVAERVGRVLEIFRPLDRGTEKGRRAVPAILEVRGRIFKELGINNVPETSFSEMVGKVADSLEALDHRYGKPFYRMPLGKFEDDRIGYLKGVDRNGARVNVDLEFECGPSGSEAPVFSFWDARERVAIRGDEVYDAIRQERVLPTVPTIILAIVTGPQIPHIGGESWKAYAPPCIQLQAAWLGMLSAEAEALTLTTRGEEAYGVRYMDHKSRSVRVSSHFSMSYVTLGREAIMRALGKDEPVEGEYGRLLRQA